MTNENNAYLTELDVKSIKIILPLLIEQAKKGKTIAYSRVNAALAHENVEQGSNQKIGRRLERIRCFTDPRKLPDLSSLVIREDTKKPSDGFIGDFERERDRCYACENWHEEEIADFMARWQP